MGPSLKPFARALAALLLLAASGVAARALAAAGDITWATRTAMTTPRFGIGLASATNGRIYAVGGETTAGAASPLNEDLNPATGAWTARASMPAARVNAGVAAATNGKVYVAGGSATPGGAAVNTLYEYDPTANRWTTRAAMPTARTGLALVAAPNGHLYAIGGAAGGIDLAVNEEYDPAADSWRSRAPMTVARSYLAGAAELVGGVDFVYVVGGSLGGIALPDAESYEPDVDAWTPMGSLTVARQHLGVAIRRPGPQDTNGLLYAIGGDDGATVLNSVERYDQASDSWVTMTPLSIARSGLGAAAGSNNRLYAVGGQTCLLASCTVGTVEEGSVELPILPTWTMFQHDPQHTGRSDLSAPSADVIETGRFILDTGAIVSQPLIGPDLTIYVGAGRYLHALYPFGAPRWRALVGDEFGAAALSGDGGLYVSTVQGANATLLALDSEGVQTWSITRASTAQAPRSLTVGPDGTIYWGVADASGTSGKLYAIDPGGAERWNFATGYILGSAPAVASDGTIYFGTYQASGGIVALNPNGTLKWQSEALGLVSSSPSVGLDDGVYVGSSTGVYALNTTGRVRWHITTGSPINYSSPAVGGDGTIYVGADAQLLNVDPDGNVRWRATCLDGGRINASPVIGADGTIVVQAIRPGYAASAAVCAFDPNGVVKWTYQTEFGGDNGPLVSSPAIGEQEVVYVGSQQGVLYALASVPGATRSNRLFIPVVPKEPQPTPTPVTVVPTPTPPAGSAAPGGGGSAGGGASGLVVSSQSGRASDPFHYVYVKVTNPTNATWYEPRVTVTYYDANGQIKGTGDANTNLSMLRPGEFSTTTVFSQPASGWTRYEVTVAANQYTYLTYVHDGLAVSQTNTTRDGDTVYVNGRITNSTGRTITNPRLDVSLYRSDGTIIESDVTFPFSPTDVPNGSSTAFSEQIYDFEQRIPVGYTFAIAAEGYTTSSN